MRALLDVNVLIALFDTDHVHHPLAMDWFEAQGPDGWATCPITQNGMVRIMSQSRYPNSLAIPELVSRLDAAIGSQYHQFLPDDMSLLDADRIDQSMLLSSAHLTDVYLLALATKHDCCLVTFDRNIPIAAVKNPGSQRLVVL